MTEAAAGPPSIGRATAWLAQGAHAAAYADALALLASRPGDAAVLDLLVRAAACAERQDEAAAALEEFRSRTDPIAHAHARVSLALLAGDVDAARRWAEGLPPDGRAAGVRLNMLVAIAQREGALAATVERMRERERLSARIPFAWLPARWAEQGRLGEHAAIIAETERLERSLPPGYPGERRLVRLHRAMAWHNRLRFDAGTADALALVTEMVETGAWPATAAPTARLGTRRRQAAVAAEIERLVLCHGLLVAIHAGTLLALVREGDFFPTDQDMDLAAIPPATSATVVRTLVDSGAFRAQPMALDAGSFRSLVHCRTGLAVDVTEYQRRGDRFVSVWRHPSGVVLRESAVPAFAARLTDLPGIGRRLPLPDAAAALLRATYGDWEKPDAAFDTLVSAPNILEFTDFLRSAAVIRLAEAMLAGRGGQVRHLAETLASRTVAPHLMERIIDAHG